MDILFDDAVSALPLTYDALAAQQKIMIETAQIMYIYEKTGDSEILQEGLMDVIDAIKENVMKLIERVKNAIRQMFMRLNSRAMSYKKLIERYKDELLGAGIKDFNIDGYVFKVGPDTRPDVSIVHDIYLKYNDQIMIFDKLSSEKVRGICEDIISDNTLGGMRAKLLMGGRTHDHIKQSDLKEASFQYYRGSTSGDFFTITVTQKDIDNIIAGYEDVIDERKFTLSQQTEINRLLHEMETFFKHTVPKKLKNTNEYTATAFNGPNAFSNTDDAKITNIADFHSFVNAKYRQTVEIANAVTTVFAERVAAIDSVMKQNEFIIRQALDHIGSGKTVNETMRLYDTYTSYPATPNKNWAGVWEGCNMLIGGNR